jgi:hypothetical protein
MKKVDITGVHRIMTRYYGSRHMVMDTNVEEKNFINPYSMKLIFDYDSIIEIDYILLLRKLRRYIFGVQFNLNIIKEENKIFIYIIMYDKSEYKDYDFEFSSN